MAKRTLLFIIISIQALSLLFSFLLKNNPSSFYLPLMITIASGLLVSIIALSTKQSNARKMNKSTLSIDTNNSNNNSFEEEKNALEKKYLNVLNYLSDMNSNLVQIFHKSGAVDLSTLVQVDIINSQASQIETVFNRTKTVKEENQSMSRDLLSISNFSSDIQRETETSLVKIENNRNNMLSISESHENLKLSIDGLTNSTRQIESSLANITQVANKTRTLSVNASIEASKAGTEGAGFKVLAKEIRTLAEGTNKYAKDIRKLLDDIRNNSEQVVKSMEKNTANIQQGILFTDETSSYMNELKNKTVSIDSMIQEMNKSVAHSMDDLENVFSGITTLQNGFDETRNQTRNLEDIAKSLSVLAEESVNQALELPGNNTVSRLTQKAQQLQEKLEQTLDEFLSNNQLSYTDLFSPDYKLVPKTSPVRYETPFFQLFQDCIKPFIIDFFSTTPGFINISVNDLKGYCPMSYPVDKPLTGKPEIDAQSNFERRLFQKSQIEKFDNSVNDRPFFLSSYPIPQMKLTITDLTLPISVRGERWGTLRIGFNPEKLEI